VFFVAMLVTVNTPKSSSQIGPTECVWGTLPEGLERGQPEVGSRTTPRPGGRIGTSGSSPPAGEGATALGFAGAAALLLRHLRSQAAYFNRAKGLAAVAAGLGFIVWFFGFMVIGGEWFQMWQSSQWNGQEAAFRFYLTILAVLIFVMQKDE
jgi:hypothetical protein